MAGNSALTTAMTIPADTGQPGSLEITLSVHDWMLIDATVDNTVAIAAARNASLVSSLRSQRCSGWVAG
jgi:hypothetical protein